jgi:DNA repair protein RecO (recombination protein O)
MNEFQDQAIVLHVRNHGEGGAIVSVLTEKYGRVNGYVNAAQSSKRLRAALQQGNLIAVDWQSKTEGQLGRFNIDIEQDFAGKCLDDPKALSAIQSISALMYTFLPEREPYTSLFSGTLGLLQLMIQGYWQPALIMWEMAFLKELGFGIDISQCAVTNDTTNLTHVSPKSGRAVSAKAAEPYIDKLLAIPQFMQGNELAKDDIHTGLRLTGYFLIHRLLQQSSFETLPDARIALENTFKPIKITE